MWVFRATREHVAAAWAGGRRDNKNIPGGLMRGRCRAERLNAKLDLPPPPDGINTTKCCKASDLFCESSVRVAPLRLVMEWR